MIRPIVAVSALALSLAGCGRVFFGPAPGDGGRDSGGADGGALDAGPADAGLDGGRPDGGRADAGPPPPPCQPQLPPAAEVTLTAGFQPEAVLHEGALLVSYREPVSLRPMVARFDLAGGLIDGSFELSPRAASDVRFVPRAGGGLFAWAELTPASGRRFVSRRLTGSSLAPPVLGEEVSDETAPVGVFDVADSRTLIVFRDDARTPAVRVVALDPTGALEGPSRGLADLAEGPIVGVAYDRSPLGVLAVLTVDDGDLELFAQLADTDGALLGSPARITDNADVDETPKLAFDGARWVVVHQMRLGGDTGIEVTYVGADGRVERGPLRVGTQPDGLFFDPFVHPSGREVMWQSNYRGSLDRISLYFAALSEPFTVVPIMAPDPDEQRNDPSLIQVGSTRYVVYQGTRFTPTRMDEVRLTSFRCAP